MVSPSLTPRGDGEGRFYDTRADQRSRSALLTVDRDHLGVQLEVEEFEALINRQDVREAELQTFFETHPHFLMGVASGHALPHVQLLDASGTLLVPDFVLRPVVAVQRDSNRNVLDLKLPQAKLIVDLRRHPRFSSEVASAIAQLKDYGDYFADPRNANRVHEVLGHKLRFPRLAILIGRLPGDGTIEVLEREQNREPKVTIVTYDEILERQRRIID